MKRSIYLLFTLSAIGGCDVSSGWHDAWYKEGASLSLTGTHLASCERQALATFPVKEEYQRGADIWIREEELCNADGECITTGGHYAPGRQELVDVNRKDRRSFSSSCMSEKGYLRTAIKTCDKSVADAVQPTPTRIWPRLTENACVVRFDNGTVQVVNLQ